MALPTYVYNAIPTDAEFNAFLRPAFDKDVGQEEFPGHLLRLTDDALSNTAGMIKPQWYAFRDALRVTAGTGLSINYGAGTIQGVNGLPIVFSAGTLTGLTNGAVLYVYVDASGAIVFSTIIPSIWFPLARVTTSGGVVTLIEDLRDRSYRSAPRTNLTKVLGGTGGAGDYTLASGSATLADGEYYFRNFTVSNGATLTISGFARIFCSGNVVINGAINVTAALTGAATVTWTGSSPLVGSIGAGVGAGIFSSSPYNPALSPVGSSGGSGGVQAIAGSVAILQTAQGGNAGGGLRIEAGGSIAVGSTGAIAANGGNAVAGFFVSGTGGWALSGAAGGTGGTIQMSSGTSISTAAGSGISCNAGTSTNGLRGGGDTTTNACGGSGSGGGQVIFSAPSVSVLGSVTVAGAAAGSNAVAGAGGFAGACGASNGGQGGASNANPIAGGAGRIITNIFLPVGA